MSLVVSDGVIDSISDSGGGGSNYTTDDTIQILASGGGASSGSGFVGTLNISGGSILSISVSKGSGYSSSDTISMLQVLVSLVP